MTKDICGITILVVLVLSLGYSLGVILCYSMRGDKPVDFSDK